MRLWQLGLVLLGVQQGTALLREKAETRRKYWAAHEAAVASGKPLLVIGGPYGSAISGRVFGFKAHGCGDVCLDIAPEACKTCPYVEGDITAIPFPDKWFGAVTAFHVLEHMPDIEHLEQAWQELHRVADAVFIAVPGKGTLSGWITQGHWLWVKDMGNGMLKAQERTGLRRSALIRNGGVLRISS